MTAADRDRMRRELHQRALESVQAWVRAHGTSECDNCGTPITQLPGKRFCGESCRKRFGDARQNHKKVAA